jgi:N-acetylglucosaminyldiphosphoundecaprenol N-acetyl-beta-D-mannosaminyltransferase
MPSSSSAPIDGEPVALPVDPEPCAVPPTTDVIGVAMSRTDYAGTMDWIDATVRSGGRGYICVAATHTVVATQDDPELAAAVRGASLVVPDGQPVVWAMNALGAGLTDRVYGPDLMAASCERGARTGTRMFLYGGRDHDTLVKLGLNLRRRFPGLQIVGGCSPPFHALTDEETDAIVAEINAARPDVVWVGIGVPKQEKWMHAVRDRLDAPVLVGVGAAFDFHAGLVPQAPAWMQSAGLEWLFRLMQEPGRLWRRYLTYNPRFVAGFTRQYLRSRRDHLGR